MNGDEGIGRTEGSGEPAEDRAQREVKLLRIAAHDLRAPLANVRSYADLALASKQPLEPRVQRALSVIRRNADRALGMVEDAIESLRMDRGGLPAEPEPTPLMPAMEKALTRSRDRAEPSRADLILELPSSLPEVIAEQERLQRVLYAPLEHLLARAEGGQVVLRGHTDRGLFVITWLATPGDALAPTPFGRASRMLSEGHMEDPVRLDLVRRLVDAWGGELSTWESDGGAARGFRLQLLLAKRTDGQLLAD